MNDDGRPAFLTTREVADLLRVKERKVYDLVAAGEIPHRRITGKLLFPAAEIMAWVGGEPTVSGVERPAVLTGSHDPLLDWALRDSGCGLAALVNGSLGGLDLYAQGGAVVCGMHLPEEEDGWNIATVAARGLRDCVLIGWARRARGLILGAGMQDRVSGFADLRGLRVALRQPEAGTSALFDRLCREAGMTAADLTAAPGVARTESEAAISVADGVADAALGIEAMARRFGLDFLPLMQERFDLLIDRRAYFTAPVQRLLAFAQTDALKEKAAAMGGYDLSDMGAVRWLSP